MDNRFINLFDAYTHGGMSRKDFLDQLAALAGSATAAQAILPILPILQNDYALEPRVPEDDARLSISTAEIPGVEKLKGTLARPPKRKALPAVLVIHENRGLNLHIKDVTRRLGLEGFLALGLDYLAAR